MKGWHPAESAPQKEAVEVIARIGGTPFKAFKDELGNWRTTGNDRKHCKRIPIMWRPLEVARHQEAAE